MGPYGFCLALGVTGLVVMAVLGFGHHGASSGHGHAGPGHAGDGHGGLGHHGSSGHHGHDAGVTHAHHGLGRLTSLLSPRVLFSFLVGVGATGLLARPFLFGPLLAGVALAGGVGFERFFVGPLWRFLFRFESRPAAMLDSTVMEEARAVTDFDAQGQGLIALELDGQVVQLLGTLVRSEAGMPRIRTGDLLRIEEVDSVRNRCTVSYAGQRPKGVLS
jgi:hypothetical protein